VEQLPAVNELTAGPELPEGRALVYPMAVGSTSLGSKSETATGSSQLGQSPPSPTRDRKVPQSSQYCSPTALSPQEPHS